MYPLQLAVYLGTCYVRGTMSENQSDELRISSNLVIQGHCETMETSTVKNTKSNELVDNLKRFWEIDSMGTNDDEND